MAKPEGERIATVEATMNALDKKMDSGFDNLNKRFDNWEKRFEAFYNTASDRFAQRDETARIAASLKEETAKLAASFKEDLRSANEEFDKKLGEIKEIAISRSWMMGATGILLGSIVSSLVVYFFNHR